MSISGQLDLVRRGNGQLTASFLRPSYAVSPIPTARGTYMNLRASTFREHCMPDLLGHSECIHDYVIYA